MNVNTNFILYTLSSACGSYSGEIPSELGLFEQVLRGPVRVLSLLAQYYSRIAKAKGNSNYFVIISHLLTCIYNTVIQVKKNARKHKSLDEDTENELREISKSSIPNSRIKECEEKDKESADELKKEVKAGSKPNDPDAETGVSEDLKEFSGRGRLKDLISSCAERDENKDKSWESAKQKVKSADEEAELQELTSLTAAKSKIIQQVSVLCSQHTFNLSIAAWVSCLLPVWAMP